MCCQVAQIRFRCRRKLRFWGLAYVLVRMIVEPLHRFIYSWFDREQSLKDHPDAIRLATRSAVCGAKLAAALCGDDRIDLGMTIAYLKRGLEAANEALDAAARLAQEKIVGTRADDTEQAALQRYASDQPIYPGGDWIWQFVRDGKSKRSKQKATAAL